MTRWLSRGILVRKSYYIIWYYVNGFFFFSSRRRHTRYWRDWSSDVCSSDLEGRLGVVVGDATGKGVPAALVISTTCGMLQLAAQASGFPSPGGVFERVNETLLARIPANMFVTCFYAILEPESASLSYANAGHDLPYLWHGGVAEELRARGMPLGLMPAMRYEQKEVVLDAGDSAFFYSDGLVEAHDPQGEMFGFPRLQELVAEHAEERLLVDTLLEELYSFAGESWEQEDDITLLTLRRSAPGANFRERPYRRSSQNSPKGKFRERRLWALR